jgi:hypothetical protein
LVAAGGRDGGEAVKVVTVMMPISPRADDLANTLGDHTTAGRWGAVPAGASHDLDGVAARRRERADGACHVSRTESLIRRGHADGY